MYNADDVARLVAGHEAVISALGRTEPIVSRIQVEMEHAVEELRFEKAAALRDQLRAIENVVDRQKVISSDYIDSDVIAMARSNGEACVQVFFIRGGKLIGANTSSWKARRTPPTPG